MDKSEVHEIVTEVINEIEDKDKLNGFDDPTKAKSNLFKYNVMQWVILAVVILLAVSLIGYFIEAKDSTRLQSQIDRVQDYKNSLYDDIDSMLSNMSCQDLKQLYDDDFLKNGSIVSNQLFSRCL